MEALVRLGHSVQWRSCLASADDPVPEVEVVVALPVSESLEEPSVASATGFAENLLEVIAESGAPRCVAISGLEAGGPIGPGSEPVFEGSPDDDPTTREGQALLAVERLLSADRDPEDTVILRPGNVFDEEEHGDLGRLADLMFFAPDDLAACWSDHRIAPIHRSDVGVAAARAVTTGSWRYHLSGVATPTLGDIANMMATAAASLAVSPPGTAAGLSSHPTSERVHWRHPHHRAERELEFGVHFPLSEVLEPVVLPAVARYLQVTQSLPAKPLRWEDRWWFLDPAEAEADRSRSTITLHAALESDVVVVDATAFAPPVTAGPQSRDPRSLVESVLSLGYSNRWLGLTCDFAARQGVLRPREGSA